MAKQTKRPTQSRAGVKTLIAVASIGCTLGGWMYFANSALADTSNTAALAQVSSVASSQTVMVPTLVPITDSIAASDAVTAQSSSTTQQNATQSSSSLTVSQIVPVAMSLSSR
jgi:hypothetical protein